VHVQNEPHSVHRPEGPLLARSSIRVAAVADIHVREHSTGAFQSLFADISRHADVLLLGGDLTDRGLPEEARCLAKELTSAINIPVLAVLGNHDVESSAEPEIVRILGDAGVMLLDGESCEVKGVGFAGVKGFAGVFGPRMLQAWGERTLKAFVHETVEEALKLESALAKLRTPKKIVIMHYAPIRATVVGEPPEIFPFLGSSRLEEPLVTFGVAAAFHGHAHAGSPEGHAMGNIPVYNVAMPLLAKTDPGALPYRVFEVQMDEAQSVAGTSAPNGAYHVSRDLAS
jgi:Icc-related predicted phosphoesterase